MVFILFAVCTYATANDPQVEMRLIRVTPCTDITQSEPLPAICSYVTVNGIRFSMAHSREDRELLSIVYYPIGEEPQVITKERMKEIVMAKQIEGAI